MASRAPADAVRAAKALAEATSALAIAPRHQSIGDGNKPTAAAALPQLPVSHQQNYPPSSSPRPAAILMPAITGQLSS